MPDSEPLRSTRRGGWKAEPSHETHVARSRTVLTMPPAAAKASEAFGGNGTHAPLESRE